MVEPVGARHESVLEEPQGTARIFGGQDSTLDSDSLLRAPEQPFFSRLWPESQQH